MHYRVVVLVESGDPTGEIVKDDIHKALVPLGFFPHVVSVTKEER